MTCRVEKICIHVRLLERESTLLSQQRKIIPEPLEIEINPLHVKVEQSLLTLAIQRLRQDEVGQGRVRCRVLISRGQVEGLLRVIGGVAGFWRGKATWDGLNASDQYQT